MRNRPLGQIAEGPVICRLHRLGLERRLPYDLMDHDRIVGGQGGNGAQGHEGRQQHRSDHAQGEGDLQNRLILGVLDDDPADVALVNELFTRATSRSPLTWCTSVRIVSSLMVSSLSIAGERIRSGIGAFLVLDITWRRVQRPGAVTWPDRPGASS